MNPEVTCVVDCGNELGECPLWSPRDQVLWWIDVARPQLWRYRPADQKLESWALPRPPAAIALRRAGGLVVAFRRGICLIHEPGPHLSELTPADMGLGEERFNDARVDRNGRLWIGSMDRHQKAPIGGLYCCSDAASLVRCDSGFALSNGMGWSPDERWMYFAETVERRIYRYRFDAGSGSLSNREVFVQFAHGAGEPDGLCVDASGCVWVALFDQGCIHQYRADGALERLVHLPIRRPTSCCFGGADLNTLYITSARTGHKPGLDAEIGAGGLWSIDLDCQGQAENVFGH